MSPLTNGKIEACAASKDLGAPDDLERVIVEFISEARSSLNIAVQELDSEPIAQAILDANRRGQLRGCGQC